MTSYIVAILIIGGLIALSLGIGYICLEFVVRMISRGLDAELVTKGPAKISSYRVRTFEK